MVTFIASVVFAVLVSFLCSLTEAALYAVPWSAIEKARRAGRPVGELLFTMRSEVDKPIAVILTCNTIANTAGAAVAVVGLVLGILWRQIAKRRWIGWSVCAAGVFLGGASLMILKFYDSALTLLCVVVPVAMLLGILWNLYDRECAWSLTILGISLIALWVCRRVLSSIYLGTYVRILAVVYIVLLLVAAFLGLYLTGNLSAAVLIAGTFLISTLEAFCAPSSNAALSGLLKAEEYDSGVSLYQAGSRVMSG